MGFGMKGVSGATRYEAVSGGIWYEGGQWWDLV